MRDHETGQPIHDAEVQVDVEGKAPLGEYTDSRGYARVVIPAQFTDQPGRLTIWAEGYSVEIFNIDLWTEQLPEEVRLKRSG